MTTIQEKIAQDIYELMQDFNPDGDLTHSEVRAILISVRRLKTRLEVLDAEMEEN